MSEVLFIIAAILFFAYILLHRSADRAEEKFANRPTIITNPAKDLLTNEKYAIVKLFAFIQGASPASAFSDEATQITLSTIFSLGLSKSEVEKVIRYSMSHDSEQEIGRIIQSLDEIRDKDFLRNLYQKCLKVATLSGDYNTIEVTKELFRKLNVV